MNTESDYGWMTDVSRRVLIVVSGSHHGDVPPEHVIGWLNSDRFWLDFLGVPSLSVLHGAAAGVDAAADEWARSLGIEVAGVAADWDTLGQAAGPVRNGKMLDVALRAQSRGWIPILRAFPSPRSKGTWDMLRKWRGANLPFEVRDLLDHPPPDLFARTTTV